MPITENSYRYFFTRAKYLTVYSLSVWMSIQQHLDPGHELREHRTRVSDRPVEDRSQAVTPLHHNIQIHCQHHDQTLVGGHQVSSLNV